MVDNQAFGTAVVVDDDADIALAAKLAIRSAFRQVITLSHPDALLPLLEKSPPDVILLDLNFARGATDGREGFLWLSRILEKDPDAAVVIITAHGGIGIAVEAIKAGATDFVTKPWDNERLFATTWSAAALRRSRRETRHERRRVVEVAKPSSETPMLGTSKAMDHVRSLIDRAAPTDANVLILGENGTGKELVARELHSRSRRAAGIMVSVDLGTVSESVFESELFGHVRGAFTDAKSDRIGRLQAANGGTIFLDEIGNLPLRLQPKLLTALERREVTPVGANKPVPLDIRVIAATNMPLDQLTDENRFRQDLLFRLNTVEIELPPLRARPEDVPLLLAHFLAHYARRYKAPPRHLSPALAEILSNHDWPGNVRALRHAAERAVILARGDAYVLDDFPLPRRSSALSPPPALAPVPVDTDLNLDRAEKQMVERALKKHNWNISLAAGELGLTRAALYRRMEKHAL
ncbi:sigma-54-dependent Fis family transcriptional regulator [Polymorphobacter glacialis]|uniref:Sigma-54-dependent Fis family transcriptional regulator n=1 Tax=Sandarakinorhabdus glacialis TaxID=1614636 RepID=A0A916ZJK7_9SPHN|nr:sigma-54 dependent transcriptional regulator [Polymorphobacter glacialis]GGE00394.1 sigma-54-dependent Fis family transcriptional regulator [Polymorphobacter glacialis]